MFLMAVINQIFLISLLIIFIKKAKVLMKSNAKLYYYFVLFYLITKNIICAFVEIKIIIGMPNNFSDIDSQNI